LAARLMADRSREIIVDEDDLRLINEDVGQADVAVHPSLAVESVKRLAQRLEPIDDELFGRFRPFYLRDEVEIAGPGAKRRPLRPTKQGH
jgi:hypothetical protein